MRHLKYWASITAEFFRDVREAIFGGNPTTTAERLEAEVKELEAEAASRKARKRTP